MNHDTTIHDWSSIAERGWDSLLLGNGASVTIDTKFSYNSLYQEASNSGKLSTTKDLFSKLTTTNFERVLEVLGHASLVNDALGNDTTSIASAYSEVREALIETVLRHHCDFAHAQPHLPHAARFIQRFKTVATLCYDLTLYWAAMEANRPITRRVKDCFASGSFEWDLEKFRKPYSPHTAATLTFYPHGSLILGRSVQTGQEQKLSVGSVDRNLLQSIFNEWAIGTSTPLFVSEGTSKEKLNAIGRSPYLKTIYDNVLTNFGEKIVVYGWSFGECDAHITKALGKSRPKELAVSVYTPGDPTGSVRLAILAAIKGVMGTSVRVVFFDSASPGCWINPPLP